MASTQYQHYIPQFLLRRFATDQPTSLPAFSSLDRKRQRALHNYIVLVKVVNLDKDPPKITQELVRKTFGQQEMYNRDGDPLVEKKLGKIEHAASRIIAQVVVAHERGHESISLSRSDMDLLRKFQFVMAYRAPMFFNRYNYETAEAYNLGDRESLSEYMRANDFQTPRDVWLDNLRKMVDIRMDPGRNWTMKLMKTIYPPDALWVMSHILLMHMAFVTPSDPEEEFVLTENAFGVSEGPVSFSISGLTGKETRTAYTEFHLFMVISPRLALVLRHNAMPAPLEDVDPEVHKQKLEMLAEQAEMHTYPEDATSFFQDLPIEKARCSSAASIDGQQSEKDEFNFVFFRLESKHVQTINMMMLDQAHTIDKLVFRSESALRKALEFYLDYPYLTKGLYSVKTITDRADDSRLGFLRKLEKLAQSLGSDFKARYHVRRPQENSEEMPFDDAVAEIVETATPFRPDIPFPMPVTIISKMLAKLEVHTRAVDLFHRCIQENDLPMFPESIYAAIQKADAKRPSQRTKFLLSIDQRVWMYEWHVLIEKSMQERGRDLNNNVAIMMRRLNKVYADPSAENPWRAERVMKSISGFSMEEIPPDYKSEYSRRGLPSFGILEDQEHWLVSSSETRSTIDLLFWVLVIVFIVLRWLASRMGLLSDELPS